MSPKIEAGEPIDGFSITRDGDDVHIILSNRYGHADSYKFQLSQARRLARAIHKAINGEANFPPSRSLPTTPGE